jgi:pilus assembly protein CpaC
MSLLRIQGRNMKLRRLFTFILFLSLVPAVSSSIAAGTMPESTQVLSENLGGTLRVRQGRSTLLRSPVLITRVSVSNPDIASVTSVEPDQILINGLGVGTATLILWTADGQEQAFDLTVEFDLPAVQEIMSTLLPEETISISASGQSLVLSGVVSSEAVTEQALAVAGTYSGAVVNLMQVATIDETVLLQVRFAEVDRSALEELGFNAFSTGATNTFGSVTTQQFGALGANTGAVPSAASRGSDPSQPNLASGGIGNPVSGQPGVFGMSDLLNVFLFRSDLNLGVTIRALQQRSLLQILAEPNILARNGVEATFLAGGEFPFPVVQAGQTGNAISITFREFGVRLQFTPDIQRDGTIRLRVAPEVSTLDFTNALTISGFLIPAISTRRAETEVDLQEGETFAIAGLIDNRTREVGTKVPVLGDLPIIGSLFRGRAERQDNTELLVMVTPQLVDPEPAGTTPEGVDFPDDFLESEDFDEDMGMATPEGTDSQG